MTKTERTLVPLRFVSESLGAKVEWNNDTAVATITLGSKIITVETDVIFKSKWKYTLRIPTTLYRSVYIDESDRNTSTFYYKDTVVLKDNVYLFSILKEENRTGHDPNAFVLYFKNNLLFTADFAGDNPYWRFYDDNGETSSTVQQVLEQYYGAYFLFSEVVLKTLQPGTVRVSNP